MLYLSNQLMLVSRYSLYILTLTSKYESDFYFKSSIFFVSCNSHMCDNTFLLLHVLYTFEVFLLSFFSLKKWLLPSLRIYFYYIFFFQLFGAISLPFGASERDYIHKWSKKYGMNKIKYYVLYDYQDMPILYFGTLKECSYSLGYYYDYLKHQFCGSNDFIELLIDKKNFKLYKFVD